MNYQTYTIRPQQTPSFISTAALEHYLHEGGWFPHKGSEEFAKNIVPHIYKAGGRVLVKALVEQILLDSTGQVIGV